MLSIGLIADFLAKGLQSITLIYLLVFAVTSYLTFHAKHKMIRANSGIITLAFCFLLFVHKIPGFNNWQLINNQIMSPKALPFTLYLKFDKPLIGLFIVEF